MKNCPVCGAPAVEDVAECFKCGSDMSVQSANTPSLMARFKEEAHLEVVDEEAPEVKPARVARRQPKAKGSSKPRRRTRPPGEAKPPTPRAKGKTKVKAVEAGPTPEGSAQKITELVGTQSDDIARATKIYSELLSRGGLEGETMAKLDEVMGEMGVDANQLKAEVEERLPPLPKAKAKTKTKVKRKSKAKDKSSKEADVAPSHCPQCGKESAANWRLCPYCGIELPPRCPDCLQEMAPDWRFCPFCGAKPG